jgi:type II secretory ATPase GspE/PulE/Tfp pilus assembly ATPase PilB-like protein
MVSRLDARGRSIQTIETPPLRYMPGWLQLSPDQPDPADLTALLASNLADVALVDLPFSESTLDACLQLGQTGCLVLAPVNLARAHHAFSLATRSLTNPFGKHLSLVMVQRLARRLCSQCARPDHSPDMRAILARAANAGLIHHAMTPACASPRGCPACRGTGYAGRVMIYELLEVDSAIQSILDDGAPASQIEQRLVADGRSLWDQAVRLLARGSTSLDAVREVIREP